MCPLFGYVCVQLCFVSAFTKCKIIEILFKMCHVSACLLYKWPMQKVYTTTYYKVCTTFLVFVQLFNFFIQHFPDFYTTYFSECTIFCTTQISYIPLLYDFLFQIYKNSTTKIYQTYNKGTTFVQHFCHYIQHTTLMQKV